MVLKGVDVSREQLVALVAVAEGGSFSGAARLLGKSQSAVSQNIAALEAELGVELFDRSGYRPKLTPVGERALDSARRIAEELDGLAGLVRSARAGVEATLSVAVDEFYPVHRLVLALRELPARYRRTRLILRTGALGDIVESLESGAAQIGVSGPLETEPEGLVREPLTTIGLLPVVSPDHPLAKAGREISPRAIRESAQIVLSDRSERTRNVKRGVVAADPWRVGSLSTKRELIVAGLGWGTMPRHLVDDDLRSGRLVKLKIAGWNDDDFPVRLDAVYFKRSPPGLVARWLLTKLASDPST
jgi:DNA-binding transcriptional LysR family regulator